MGSRPMEIDRLLRRHKHGDTFPSRLSIITAPKLRADVYKKHIHARILTQSRLGN